jgi:hypothetical protein
MRPAEALADKSRNRRTLKVPPAAGAAAEAATGGAADLATAALADAHYLNE